MQGHFFAGKTYAERFELCVLILIYSAFFLVWATLGFVLWVLALVRTMIAFNWIVIGTMFGQGDKAHAADTLKKVVQLWPRGFRDVRQILFSRQSGKPIAIDQKIFWPVLFTYLRELFFAALFAGLIYWGFFAGDKWYWLSLFFDAISSAQSRWSAVGMS